MFIRLVTSAKQRNRIWVHLRNWISESCLQNMALSTLLILAICRTCVIFKPRSPQSLCGSVVAHQSAESEGLRFDSSRGLQNFSLFHARDISIYLFTEQKNYHLSYSFQKTFIDLWHVAVFFMWVSVFFSAFWEYFLIKTHQSAPRKRGLEWNQKTFGR